MLIPFSLSCVSRSLSLLCFSTAFFSSTVISFLTWVSMPWRCDPLLKAKKKQIGPRSGGSGPWRASFVGGAFSQNKEEFGLPVEGRRAGEVEVRETWWGKATGKSEARSQLGCPKLGDSELGHRNFATLDQRPPTTTSRRMGEGRAAELWGVRFWSTALAGKLWEPLCVECKTKQMSRLWFGVFFFSIF